ncbi:MAG: hypothetical protein HFI45_01075 [Lachnospiraceae bacterium]|nr:hypothetical protein [Lachnospiraceae bacterium]
MENKNGEWIMRGMSWDDPCRIRTWKELVNWIKEIGFLPFFANEVKGFSAEEHVSPDFWWTGDLEQDPWEWRKIIAERHEVAYGKFFGKRAGFISLEWLPYFVNSRRCGYDFDARWEDGRASRREKKIMDFFISENEDGSSMFKETQILSSDLKKQAGFGNGGDKNFPGIITQLQMETYLVIAGFRQRKSKRGSEYGMSVSILLPPESIWGYDRVTAAYSEDPKKSWERQIKRVRELYPDAQSQDIIRLIGKEPNTM